MTNTLKQNSRGAISCIIAEKYLGISLTKKTEDFHSEDNGILISYKEIQKIMKLTGK